MGILYLISVLILLISFILIKKSDKLINIFGFINISIVALFCYNAFVCYILTFFTIPITLWLLALINIVISIALLVPVFRKKEIQKYIFYKRDLIYISLIAIIVLITSYINFGIPFNVKYETSDPSVHYLTAVMFAESDALLAGAEEDPVYPGLNNRKMVSYTNSGLLMKSLCPDLEPMECYNVFVCFGIFTLFMTGSTLYSLFQNFAKNKEHSFFAFIVATIGMLGYPLNSFLFGFEYLSMSLLVICVIIDLSYYYEKDLLKLKYFVILMALLNFGLFGSYYMFVPFVYPALWIYFCIKNYRKNKKIVTKELIILLSVTLLIPFILGIAYHIMPELYTVFINDTLNKEEIMEHSSYLVNTGFNVPGYIYINLYSNILLLIPLTIYFLIKGIRKKDIKENTFLKLLFVFIAIYMIIFYIGYLNHKVSIYYVCKNYFALWIILMCCNYKALILLAEKHRYISRLCIYGYVFVMIICTIFSDVKMIDDSLKNKDENIFTVMEIFGSNKTLLIKEEEKLNQDEIELLMYARENLDYNSKIEVVTEGIQYYWSYALLDYINKEERLGDQKLGQRELNIKVYLVATKINKVDYMIYFKESRRYKSLEDELFENAEIIYENSAGGILKYNR